MKRIKLLVIFCLIAKIAWGQSDGNATEASTSADRQERTLAASMSSTSGYLDPKQIARTMPSPNTNFAIRDIDIATDKYTGIANVRIPIYAMEVNNSSIPIELIYTASGIRADDVTSTVGLGWRLKVGGKITRSIRGKNDNLSNNPPRDPGYWDAQLLGIWLTQQWDTQPDQFYFELPNSSGSFIMDSLGIGCPIPYQNIKIEHKNSKFKIFDEQGACYSFSTCDITDEYYSKTQTMDVLNYFSPWHLDQIEYLNGDKVELYYERDSLGTNTTHYQYLQAIRAVYNNSAQRYELYPDKFDDLTQNTHVINPHYLNKIVYKDQQIEFIYARESSDDIPYGKRLTDIIVKHIRGTQTTQVRRLKFLYDRFDHNRLKLAGIKEMGTEQLEHPICNFEYFEDVEAPARDSYGIDSWGYFCSNTKALDKIFPLTQLTCDINSSFPKYGLYWFTDKRISNLQYTRVQSLKKIVYPNGGSTELVYELHRGFDKKENKEMDAGGLRIKQIIKHSSQTDAPMIYKYEYEGGVVYDDQKNYILTQIHRAPKDTNENHILFYISSRNLSPSIDYYGASVVYAAVKEYLPNGSCIRYDYVPYDDFPDLAPSFSYSIFGDCPTAQLDAVKNSITPKISRSWGRNLLKSKTSYNSDSVVIDSTTYQYQLNSYNTKFFVGHTLQGSLYDDGGVFNKLYRIGLFLFYSTPVHLTKMTVHKGIYNSAGQTTYVYNPNTDLLSSSTKVDSEGTSTITTYTYPQDFDITDTTSIIGRLKQRNVIIPLEEITSRNGKIIAAKGRSFRFNEMKSNAIVVDCDKSLRNATPIEAANFTTVNCTSSGISFNNYYKNDKKYLDYNADGQLLCYEDQSGIRHSFVYRNTTRPIATVLNARHSERAAFNQVYFNDLESDSESESVETSRSGYKSRLVFSATSFALDRKLAPGAYSLAYYIEGGRKLTKPIEIISADSYPLFNPDRYFGHIDDISILPQNATISTSYHVPGWGNTMESDERGQAIYTEYNGLGLPVKIKDNNKTVVKKLEYY